MQIQPGLYSSITLSKLHVEVETGSRQSTSSKMESPGKILDQEEVADRRIPRRLLKSQADGERPSRKPRDSFGTQNAMLYYFLVDNFRSNLEKCSKHNNIPLSLFE